MSDKLPPGHSASAHKDKVGSEMHRFKRGELHSGTGKKGKKGPIVKNRAQAIAIALSVAGKSKTSNHAERLMSMGYSEQVATEVASMLEFAEIDWEKQFNNGKGPGPEKLKNYHTGMSNKKGRGQLRIGKGPGDMGKLKVNSDAEMLSPVSYPRGPVNPQGGSSKEVFGLRALG